MRALLLAFALAACSTAPPELPAPQLPQRAGVDPVIAARAEGVVFRAEGSDPAFVLHLYRDNSILLSWDNGAHQERFPATEPQHPAWSGEVYFVANERYRARIEVRDRPCRDRAFGDAVLPRTVIVSIGGEDFLGCGRAL